MGLLHEVADAVAAALRRQRDWGPSGTRVGQYALDVSADDAALSEESGLEDRRTGELVVIDPVDGSTNCSRGIPWYATSMCLVDREGPACALVVNQASGVRYWAERGGGARFATASGSSPAAAVQSATRSSD
jgi:fructose-1,6-bisphosphatase/inositol monophosphatase family enzyme